MSKFRIVQPPDEKFSWINELVKTPIGEKFGTPKEFSKSLKSIISRDVKIVEPGIKFTTDSTSDPEFLIVERKA